MKGYMLHFIRWIGIPVLLLFVVFYFYWENRHEGNEGAFLLEADSQSIFVEAHGAAAGGCAGLFRAEEGFKDPVPHCMMEESPEDVRNLFAWLSQSFGQVRDYAEHMEAVRGWLLENHGKERAEVILSFYRPYIESEMALAAYLALRPFPRTLEDSLVILEDIGNFRMAYLGEEYTKWLFGSEMARTQYRMTRKSIITDPETISREKLHALEELDSLYRLDRDEAPPAEGNAHQRYRELMAVHQADFGRMASEEEKRERIRELRQASFSDDVVAGLEALDQEVRAQQEKENVYRQQKSAMEQNPYLDSVQKEREMEELRNRFFGDDADTIIRRERIEADVKERMETAEKNKG
ncbi:lipase chaperone [Desulfobotulus sp. H1]|uniref:Lipase helper protein n=1 Tax=Desulfobotulus pelophilus TaxID=2823377 RepID=A0ABT3NA13_9BACT|nr:lipase secretion chaperone [Desulfobotulus pelophilus]MCW7754300.1 lipase chaperone [Desulfobotulus pelophilus]